MTRVDLLLADESLHSDDLQAESGAPEIEWLVDNIDAYNAIAAAVHGARTSISISQLAFDVISWFIVRIPMARRLFRLSISC